MTQVGQIHGKAKVIGGIEGGSLTKLKIIMVELGNSTKLVQNQVFHGCERCVQVVNATRELEAEREQRGMNTHEGLK